MFMIKCRWCSLPFVAHHLVHTHAGLFREREASQANERKKCIQKFRIKYVSRCFHCGRLINKTKANDMLYRHLRILPAPRRFNVAYNRFPSQMRLQLAAQCEKLCVCAESRLGPLAIRPSRRLANAVWPLTVWPADRPSIDTVHERIIISHYHYTLLLLVFLATTTLFLRRTRFRWRAGAVGRSYTVRSDREACTFTCYMR